MIKKLRNRFIFITMLLLTAALIAVFVSMFLSSKKIYQQECRDELMRTIDELRSSSSEKPNNKLPPAASGKTPAKPSSSNRPENKNKPGGFKQPSLDIFTVLVNSETSEIISSDMGETEISENNFNLALKTAFADDDGQGTIYSIPLRYMSRETSKGTIYAFADITSEVTALQQQALVTIFTGLIGLIAFFLITLLLSSIAMRPTEEAYIQQKQFIADASHELRTPLTVILANTSILTKSNNSPDNKKWIDSTYTEAIRMKQLVDDMLFLARSDAEKAAIEKTDLNFTDIVWSAALPFEAVLLEKNVKLDTGSISPNVHIKANEAQIKQLASLVFDNACKYVNSGGKVTVALKKENDKKAVFSVTNTGSYISEEDIKHIFERFYRADKARTYTGGHGLGLSIADRIVKQHKGKITASSNKETGTTFTIILPTAQKGK